MSLTQSRARLVAMTTPAEPQPLVAGQQRLVEAVRGNGGAMILSAGPASGKTTALVASVVDQVRAGLSLSELVVLTGSRPAAQALRARVVAALGTSQRGLQVTTVHGWCMQLAHRFADAAEQLPRLLTAPEQEFRVRELLGGHPAAAWPSELQAALGTRGFAAEVRRLIARARQLGLDPDALAGRGADQQVEGWASAAGFYQEYQDVLDAEGVIDYAELVLRTRLLLLDEQVQRLLPTEARLIFCDEFAEYDPGMIELLAQAGQLGCRVIASSDPSTRVFGFRGADRRADVDFEKRFDRPGQPALRLGLGEALQTSGAIRQAMAEVSRRLGGRALPTRVPEAATNGAVEALLVADEGAQAELIATRLRQAHLVDGYDWSELAVITRSGKNAVSALARRLSAAGVPVRVAGDEVALGDEVAVRQLLAVLLAACDLAAERALTPGQAAALLRGPVGGMDALALRRAGRKLRARAQGSDQSDEIGSAAELLAAELGAAVLTAGQQDAELGAVVRLRELLAGLAKLVAERAEVTAILWQAWSATGWPARLQEEALASDENSPRAHRDLDAVLALFDLAQRGLQWAGAGGVRELVAAVAGQQIPADTARESDPRSAAVQVLTVHRAKGQCWPVVALAGLQEGSWPALGPASGLLRVGDLTADDWSAPLTMAEQLADERRSFLLAISRARQRLIATAVADPGGAVAAPSRFLAELGVPVIEVTAERTPTTLAELVAELRRVLADPTTSPALADQAAAELAWLGTQTDGRGRPLAPAADPANWWGLRELTRNPDPASAERRPIRLTGSGVELLLACPRRWFCSRRVRADRPAGASAAFGSVLHALIDQASRGAHREQLLARLDEVWPRLNYEAGYQSVAERAAAEAALDAYQVWAASDDHTRVLGTEVGFELPIEVGGHSLLLVGAIDRLEADASGRIRVVDFKTSRKARSGADVAAMDQLGIYQLAVRAGVFDELTGGRRELADAEAVYLRDVGAGGAPTVRLQPSLDTHPGSDATDGQTWVHQRLARAAEIVASEQYPAQVQPDCKNCPFLIGCPAHRVGVEEWEIA